ncbi:MAG: flagellar hook-length control protein FliK [Proteobacteria bacterium]|nr:flagellar hook-length control protein FliK [Pseudomonadota bacterium]
MNPLANMAIAAKSTDTARGDNAAASGKDAADTGFSRELQRHIDRDTQSSGTADAAPTTSTGKASDGKPMDSKAAPEVDSTKEGAPAGDAQTPSPDMAALLGGLLTSGANAPSSGTTGTAPQSLDGTVAFLSPHSSGATGATPASAGKTSGGKRTDSEVTATADSTKEDATAADAQLPSSDTTVLLGSLPPPGVNAPSTRRNDDNDNDDSNTLLTNQPTESQPAADTALAALLAAGRPPATSTNTVTLAGERSADETVLGSMGERRHASLDLADSPLSRQTLTNPAQGQSSTALEAELTDTTAKLAAANEASGKYPDLAGENTPTNNFAGIHAAALANLRGESAAPATSPVPLHVATPAGSPGWPEEVGSRVSWMVGHEESHAQLTLTPPQLGKIEVSITVSGDQTSAQFVAATPAARELIEQSLPRLRELLEQSGINLGQTDVGTSGQSNNSGDGRRGHAWGGQRGTDDGSMSRVTAPQWIRRGDGLVDTFA